MDIVSHFELKRRPFQLSGEETAYRSEPFLAARGAVADAAMAWTSPIVVKGAPGTGKSVLLAELGRHLNARDRKSVIFSTPALATAADFAAIDVALVDEADSASPELLAQLVGVASDLGTVLVLAGLDPPLASPPALTVTLGAMGPQDAYDFLLTAVHRSGRPDLFRPAALDALVAAAHGVPRVLKLLASAAMLEAMLEDAKVIERQHAERAIENKSPLPRAPEPVESVVAMAAAPAAPPAAVPEPELPTARAAPEAWLDADTDDEPVQAAAIPLPVYFRPRDPADVDLPPEAEYEFEEPRSRRFGSARGAVAAVLALILVGGGAVALGGAQLGIPNIGDMLGQPQPDTDLPVAAVAPEPALPPASAPVEQAAISPDLESATNVPLTEAPAPELAAADASLVPQPAAEADEEEAPAKSPAQEAAEIADAQRGGITLVPGITPPPSQLRIPPGYRPSAARFPSLSAAAEAGLPLAPGTAPE